MTEAAWFTGVGPMLRYIYIYNYLFPLPDGAGRILNPSYTQIRPNSWEFHCFSGPFFCSGPEPLAPLTAPLFLCGLKLVVVVVVVVVADAVVVAVVVAAAAAGFFLISRHEAAMQ